MRARKRCRGGAALCAVHWGGEERGSREVRGDADDTMTSRYSLNWTTPPALNNNLHFVGNHHAHKLYEASHLPFTIYNTAVVYPSLEIDNLLFKNPSLFKNITY